MMPHQTVAVRALNSDLESFEILRGSGVAEKVTQLADGKEATSWYAIGPWAERAQLSCSRTADMGSTDDVLLASFGADFVELAHGEVVPLLAQRGESRDVALAAALCELRERLHAQLRALGVRLGDDGPADVIVTPPGAESTSFNYAERRYMGLHIDQHDGLSLARRGQARRLCLVNIGWQHRYVYVHPYRVMDLCHAVGIFAGADDQEPLSREVTEAYFAAHQDAGIMRIRLEAGCGYLMNAQDLVHDGAVPAGDSPGVAFHSVGTLQAWPEAATEGANL
jgi:hypothetical protein